MLEKQILDEPAAVALILNCKHLLHDF